MISFNPSIRSGIFLGMETLDHRVFKRLPLEFRSLEWRNTMYLDLPATALDNSMWLLSYIKITGGLLSGKSRYCFSLKCSVSQPTLT